MNKLLQLCLYSLVNIFLLAPGMLQAAEVIQSYHSDIQVFENGDMRVTETIVVKAEHKKIKRGIYRDFPLKYEDRFGNNYKVGFSIAAVRRNGKAEPFHTKNMSNGIRIYIGVKDRSITKGTHKFEITYQTNRQLGFFEQHDELYWNVTGNDWAFPILKASANVILPKGISPYDISVNAYTGAYGSAGSDYEAYVNEQAVSEFQTTRKLAVREGLTIVVGWPKGHVIEPDMNQKIEYILKDNAGILAGFAGLLLLIVYYLFVWSQVGRDPEKGVIFPHYEPPSGYSPASMRFINNMGYDKTCFAVALVNLAVKRYITITEDDDGDYSLLKEKDATAPLAAGEKTLLSKLFTGGNILEMKQSNHRKISAALDAHESSLERNYEKIYFKTNSGYFYFGLVLSLAVFIYAIAMQADILVNAAPVLFLMVWLSIWSISVFALLKTAWLAWKRVTHSVSSIFTALLTTAFAIPFVAAEVFVFGMFARETSWFFPVMIVVGIGINWLFYELLKAPTRAGRDLMDKIDGFKNYIEVAEKHDLEYKYAGGKTPELFERILPFAIALGIEKIWGEQFQAVLQQAAATSGASYRPGWYHGSSWSVDNLSGFTSSMGSSLSSAVASSSTAPGSSSGGGGGGGFSGGGGGGGGGGGW